MGPGNTEPSAWYLTVMSKRKSRRIRARRESAEREKRPWYNERTNWYAIGILVCCMLVMGLMATKGSFGRGTIFIKGAPY